MRSIVPVSFAILLGAVGVAQQETPSGDNSVTPGELIVEPPTLINLGFEWLIDGDTNRNARVDVSYGKAGDGEWKRGLPLLRLQHERVTQPNVFNLVSPNMFAGSLLDLEPDTAYEARFVLSDPDGVRGPASNATKTVTVRTRPEPKPAGGGKVYHVYPVGHTGPKVEPAFTGIMCAYNYYCGAGDTAPGGRPRLKPGDIILVHAGTYAYRYELYANQTTVNATTTFEGTYYLTADGTPERPIVIKADSSSDYNGFRPNPGAATAFRWNVGPPPAPAAAADSGFATLADYVNAIRQDQHSITVDYDVFMNVPQLTRDPKTVQRLYEFKDLDFRLKSGSAAIDRGVTLPNINDGFTGNAPDLGALEAGQPLPIYGPRP